MMRAWFYKQYGPLDKVLQEGEWPLPEVGAHQVLVRVIAAALNPVDFMRVLGFLRQIEAPLPHIPGCDVAGVVVKVGSEVKHLHEGDEVFGVLSEHGPQQFGSLSQYAAVNEDLLARKPPNLSFAEAASLPLAMLTAKTGFQRAHFRAGQSVLILGGSGGVASLAVQLAKVVYGASFVVATASTAKVDFVKSLGADMVIDYTQSACFELSEKYDFVFDIVGDTKNAVKAMKDGGVVLTVADLNPTPPATFYVGTCNGASLTELQPFLASGQLKPIIDRLYPFSEVKEALKYVETRKAVGKVVIFPIHQHD